METVRIPGQKCEVIYLQLKRQPRLRYTTTPCPKGCADPRNMPNNKEAERWDGGEGRGRKKFTVANWKRRK